ncbi:hypothetical protein H9635_05915 [Solibacillus sp. A46]|uniref:Uncharacterized protein n=1 Tax=Solibacillus faecavium TaxID=2762221 RepID=A0ABR8XWE9_9BACL|nr:hypothetical protein [Solibacillus faecavium]MBD8036273.1 hypothetical protein [Solibacillus faecavium]
MKKLLLILVIVGVIQITSTLYYDAKMLDEPIPVAGTIDFANKTIKFSYITNSIDPHEFQSIEFNGHHYYPEQPFSMFNAQPQTTLETYVKYTYYSMISPVIWLYENEDLTPLDGVTKGTIHFKDRMTTPISLTTYEYEEIPQLEFLSSSVGTDGTSGFYKVLEPFTLKQINVVDNRVNLLNFKINGKVVQLPLTAPLQLNNEDKLYLETTDGEAQYEMELFKLELHIVDNVEKDKILTLTQFLNTRPSEDWVNSLVKERGEL